MYRMLSFKLLLESSKILRASRDNFSIFQIYKRTGDIWVSPVLRNFRKKHQNFTKIVARPFIRVPFIPPPPRYPFIPVRMRYIAAFKIARGCPWRRGKKFRPKKSFGSLRILIRGRLYMYQNYRYEIYIL